MREMFNYAKKIEKGKVFHSFPFKTNSTTVSLDPFWATPSIKTLIDQDLSMVME